WQWMLCRRFRQTIAELPTELRRSTCSNTSPAHSPPNCLKFHSPSMILRELTRLSQRMRRKFGLHTWVETQLNWREDAGGSSFAPSPACRRGAVVILEFRSG